MKKAKYLLACALAVQALSIPPVLAEKTDYSHTINVMTALDLVPDYDSRTFDASAPIKRSEFAGLMGVYFKDRAVSNNMPYTDVGLDTPYARDINLLYDMGCAAYDTKFNPGNNITLSEAAKIAVCVLGYTRQAERIGQYAAGYISLAAEHDLFDDITGIGANSEMTWGEALQLVYNMHEAKMQQYSVVTDGAGNVKYEYEEGDEFLEATLGIYNKEGIVRAVGAKSLDGEETNSGYVLIDNETYKSEFIDIPEILGCEAEFYYRGEDDSEKTLLYIENESEADGNITVIDSRDLISYSRGTFVYDKNGRARTENIETSSVIVYNYRPLKSDQENIISSVQDGEFRLIDADGNGSYETLIVCERRDYVVEYFSSSEQYIISKNSQARLLYNDDTEVTVHRAGMLTPIHSLENAGLTPGTVVTIVQSLDGSVIDAAVSEEYIEGMVRAVRTEDGVTYVTVDDTEYRVSRSCDKSYFKAGEQSVFDLNVYGEIAWVSGAEDQKYMKTGVVAAIASDEDTETLSLRILEYGGELSVIKLSDSLTVDGVSHKNVYAKYRKYAESGYTADGGLGALFGDGVKVHRRLIRYRINSRGEICEIDTPVNNPGTENAKDTVIQLKTGYTTSADVSGNEIYTPIQQVKEGGTIVVQTQKATYKSAMRKLSCTGSDVYVAADARIYVVPRDVNDWDDGYYETGTPAQMLKNYKSYWVMAYNMSEDDVYASDVVIYDSKTSTGITSDSYPAMIKNIEEVYDDEEGETINRLEVLTSAVSSRTLTLTCANTEVLKNVKSMYNADPEAAVKTYELGRGDIIRYELDSVGEVTTVEMIYSRALDEMATPNPIGQTSSSIGTNGKADLFRIHRMYTYDLRDDFGFFSHVNPASSDFSEDDLELHKIDTTVVFVCEGSGSRPDFEVLDKWELMDYKKFGEYDMSRIFLYTRQESPSSIFLYRQ